MKVRTKTELTKELQTMISGYNEQADIVIKLDNDLRAKQLTIVQLNQTINAYACKIDIKDEIIKTQRNDLYKRANITDHLEGELKEREHRLQMIDSDHAQEVMGYQHLIDKHKRNLYDEQIKSTAYMTVIKSLHKD